MQLKEIQLLAKNKINLSKKNYTVIIGSNPSKTARSPILWNYFFKKTKEEMEMIPIDTTKKNIKKIINVLSKDKKFKGGCVTIPFKEIIFKELLKKNSVDKITKKIGSVNCLYKKNNKIFGTNTDGDASLKVFKKKFGNVKNKKCLILGFGGVGKAVSAFFNSHLNSNVVISNRTNLSKKIIKKNNIEFIKWKEIPKVISEIDIIINCTSLGFNKNKKSPINFETFKMIKKNAYFFDVIYNPLETTFLKLAKLKSKNIINGLEMNKLQAILAIKKVQKNKISLQKIKKSLSKF
jgi:shikimate dehydrogenase